MGNRNWKQFNWDYTVVTSGTGIETFVNCPRAWIFEKIWRLPRKPIAAGPFGDCLHDVAQRYAEADERGIDPRTGQEVDLFPDGWDAEVSASDAELIRALIIQAIEKGVLRRLPNAVAELPFQYEAAQGASVMGFGDYVAEDGYEDHKTTKSFRYNKTKEELATNIQMLIGAAVVITRALQQGVELKEVWLRHNYFLKDRVAPKVKPVETTVTADAVRKFWEEIVLPVTAKMVDWKRKLAGTTAEKWREIPKATSAGVCRAYGGCSFAAICGGKESPSEYSTRMEREIKRIEQDNQERNAIMSDIFATAKKRKKPVPAPELPKEEETPQAESAQAEEPQAEAAPKAEDTEPNPLAAPWYQPGCVACSENPNPGFNSRGMPCKACDAARRRAKLPTSADYTVTLEDGVLIIEPKNEAEQATFVTWVGGVDVIDPPAVSKAEDTPKQQAKQAEAVRKVQAATADTPAPDAVAEEPLVPPQAVAGQSKRAPTESRDLRRGGRPKGGLTILYGTQKRHKGKTITDMHTVLRTYGTALAEKMGASSYYDLDFGKRRDWLASKAEAISEELGTALVCVTGSDPDVMALASALEPFAHSVYLGG